MQKYRRTQTGFASKAMSPLSVRLVDIIHYCRQYPVHLDNFHLSTTPIWKDIIVPDRSGYSPGGRVSKTYLPGRWVNNLLFARQRKLILSRCQLTYSCFRVRFNLTYFTIKSKVHQNPKYTMPSKYQTDQYPTHSTSTTQLNKSDLTPIMWPGNFSTPKLTWPNPIQHCPTLPYPITPAPIPP